MKDYDEVFLWEVYFKGCEQLSKIIDLCGISSLAELEYREGNILNVMCQNLYAECRNESDRRER